MLRTVSLTSKTVRIAIKQYPIFLRLQHQKIQAAAEPIPKICNKEEIFDTKDPNESLLKNSSRLHVFTSDTKLDEPLGGSEAYWKSFQRKYKNRDLRISDVISLFRGVHKEANYEKYQEAPSAVYTISCCSLFPLCSTGLLTLITGGALPGLAFIQLTYSASILSFLGGVAFAHAVTQPQVSFENLGWAVAPPLLAWSSILLPMPVGFILTASGMTVSMIHDVLLTSYPQWFKSLRYILTLVTLVSLLPAFVIIALRF